MTATIHVSGIREAQTAFNQLPRRVRFKHLRIALNAGGGVVRNCAAGIVRRKTGLLAKSLGVKVVIPDASYNAAHHGKPAYAIIGPKRQSGRFMRSNSKGNLRGYGAAQRELNAERKRLKTAGVLSPLQREKQAVRFVKASFSDGQYRNPVMYAHLVEKGHAKGKGRSAARPYPFLSTAATQTKSQVASVIGKKLQDGINTEAASLSRQ